MKLKKEGIEQLVEKSKDGAYFRAKQFFKNDADIEDVLQISYIKAFKKIEQLDNKDKFNVWFYRIVINTCKDQLKKRNDYVFSDIGNEDTEIEIVDDQINLNPRDAMDYQDTKDIVSNILNELPDGQRLSLYLYYYESYNIKEIAEYFEVNEATVKSRLRYGKLAVKEKVEDYQKAHDVKLYSTAIVPLVSYALFNIEEYTMCPKEIGMTLARNSVKKVITNTLVKKTLIALTSSCIVVAGGKFMYLNSLDEVIELKNKSMTIEYGESISTSAKDYLLNDNKELLKEAKVNFNEKNKEYLSLGNHDIKISYRDQELIFKVIVKDTIKPKFVEYKEELEFEEGSEEIDFLSYFKAKDLSKVTLALDDGTFDVNTPGEYKVIVTASDVSGNKSIKELNVKINAKEKEEEIVEEEYINPYQNANLQQEVSTPQVNLTPTYDMSNPVVARAIELVGTVNEGGLGEAGIAGSFVCDDLAEAALAAGGISYEALRSTGSQYPYSQAQPGDLLVYTPVPGSGVSGHVAIYIGNGMAVHGNFSRVTTIFSATGLNNLQEPLVLR